MQQSSSPGNLIIWPDPDGLINMNKTFDAFSLSQFKSLDNKIE